MVLGGVGTVTEGGGPAEGEYRGLKGAIIHGAQWGLCAADHRGMTGERGRAASGTLS